MGVSYDPEIFCWLYMCCIGVCVHVGACLVTCVLFVAGYRAWSCLPRSAFFLAVGLGCEAQWRRGVSAGEQSGVPLGLGLGPHTSGSRTEGLILENGWGHEDADSDEMWLNGGLLGVFVAGGQHLRGESCLEFRPEGCPPAYCKLQISDLHALEESMAVVGVRWFNDTRVKESDGVTRLSSYHVMRHMKDSDISTCCEPVSGPASQSGAFDIVNTLVCSDAHPNLHHEFRSCTRGSHGWLMWSNTSSSYRCWA